jgi:hypothetical protein
MCGLQARNRSATNEKDRSALSRQPAFPALQILQTFSQWPDFVQAPVLSESGEIVGSSFSKDGIYTLNVVP